MGKGSIIYKESYPGKNPIQLSMTAQYFTAKTWEDLKMLAEEDKDVASAISTANALMEDEEVRARMEAREDYYRRMRTEQRKMREKDEQLAEKDEQLAKKDEQLVEIEKQRVAEREKLQEEIERLREQIAEMQESGRP
jgi:hypothetical protein